MIEYSSIEQVKNEVKQGSKLIVHEGSVYDVSEFLKKSEHPGGNEFIENELGNEVSYVMKAQTHTEQAYRMLAQYKIGYIANYKIVKPAISEEPSKLTKIDPVLLKRVRDKYDLNKGLLY